ncbi:MAG: hypothetical protein ABL995_08395 [Bryobacteraceae bacterium]
MRRHAVRPVHPHATVDVVELLREHRKLGISTWKQICNAGLVVVLTTPLLYVCLIPLLILDAAVTFYQWVCFPLYGIPTVRRSDYLIFDRGKLPYLNVLERVGCIYCSYANGLLSYATEIAGRTEQYFCPIRHQRAVKHPHSRYPHFLPFGNASAYRAHAGKVAKAYQDLTNQDVTNQDLTNQDVMNRDLTNQNERSGPLGKAYPMP